METETSLATYTTPAPRTLAVCEHPRNRARLHGPGGLSDVELLALVIQGAAGPVEAAIESARKLINYFGSVPDMLGKPVALIQTIGGVTEPVAFRVVGSLELSRRANMAAELPAFNSPERVFSYMAPTVAGVEVEKVWILCLNKRLRLIRRVELTSGTAVSCLAHPREVFRAVIAEGAVAFVLVHNHPSGDPCPSASDMNLTKLIRDAARVVDLEFADHVIMGRANADPLGCGFFSFRAAGML